MTVYDAAGYSALSESSGWTVALAALLIGAVALAAVCGWRERRMAPRGWVTLLGLRLLAIAAVGLVIAGVERRPLSEQEVPSRVVVLVDRSASMELPATDETGAAATRAAAATPGVEELAAGLAASHLVRRAGFDVALEYVDAVEETSEAAGATRLGSAVERVLADHAATPLAALVIASDGGWNAGPDPLDAADAAKSRGVPIYALGVGPLREPPTVSLRDLAAPTRAATGDNFRVSVTVAANGAASLGSEAHRVSLVLRPIDAQGAAGAAASEERIETPSPEGGGLTGASADLEGPSPGAYELVATLQPAGRDADESDNVLSTRIEFVDEPTRVLLAAGGPARDYHFLRDQLHRDEQFACDVLLQSAAGAVTQDAGKVLTSLPATADEWEAYDVLVAIDFDWRQVDASTTAALAEWVSSRGGGLAFVAGNVSTPGAVRAGLEAPLRTLLPVTLRDDPLAMGSTAAAVRDARPVVLSTAGESLDWLNLRLAGDRTTSVWRTLDGFYATTLPAEPKPGAAVLATLGEGATQSPLLVEQLYGAGRVDYLASPETWRLRTVAPELFTELYVGWLRSLTQGRLLGAAAEGSLLFDRRRYDLGELMTLRYVARDPSVAITPTARVAGAAGAPSEVTLVPVEGQPGVYAATVKASDTGRWTATLEVAGGERLTATAEASLPALENETRVQNVALLRDLAEQSGGRYVDLADPQASAALAEIIEATPSLAETTIDLGPPDEGFAERLSRWSLGVMAGALLLEWLLRRAWRLA
ncbi:hypothetical protein [Botrimarina mediterranea]|uniref:VWFA domain-containing protein n=1 Tax=Botrimarina mediterranea TaxID=2528022 RepID=A0A518K590_9BACT|nr:hypothetical protein [Botrimarina mediterranea]QDV72961.1 hypothetical protein Spa11_11480 [Botrimarina mediterranea]QDV77535.1 hypothetical protein K2D_11310 [Planctomycetes bacterium K2D]